MISQASSVTVVPGSVNNCLADNHSAISNKQRGVLSEDNFAFDHF